MLKPFYKVRSRRAKEIDEDLLAQSQQGFIELCALVNQEVINLDDFKMLIEESREALESFKYRILEFNSKCDQRGYLAGSTE
ncbi:hypothetical protein [Pseudoalteromonas lipolytica]